MSQGKPKVAVVGATGYAGAELVRLLLAHPEFELASVVSRSANGKPLSAVHPGLRAFSDLVFEAPDPARLASYDSVLLAVPHGAATELAAALSEHGAERIVDLSSDHRHHPDWVYGQAEWNTEQLRSAHRIAVPGCFATAITVALAPFVDAGWIAGPVQCVAATGSTGAGATPGKATHHPERLVNLKAYKVLEHQHTPEVEVFLRSLGAFERLHFVPLSAPLDRGILATCFFEVADPDLDPALLLSQAYEDKALVRVGGGSPEVRHVRGTGLCDLSVARDGRQVAVISALDNLGKGAAFQALQCLNLSLDLPVNTGLKFAPCLP
ncbi:MAG: N-acetyl-gamma-glutamyl-phosphate reductase [Myxococcota bacterium]|nr:N-acetyl-gamma-glutamyl-phosphate reductase [Myxococcota bacterium]